MKRQFFTLLWILVVLALLAVAYGFYRTWKTGKQAEYAEFTKGTVPSAMPEGLMKGRTDELGDISWKGKKFFSGTGINLLEKDGEQRDAYPFTFYTTTDIEGNGRNVIRLDYEQQENPLWLRFIVDEMVSTEPGKYLGAVYIKLIPRLPFRMGHFRLEK